MSTMCCRHAAGRLLARVASLFLGLLLLAASPPGQAQVTWTFLVWENQTFTVTGTRTVRYGVEPNWITRTVTGTVPCTNAFFGGDPAFGVGKACYLSSAPAETWSHLTWEGLTFNVSGTRTVRFGAEPNWVTRIASGSMACTNAAFGFDPAFGISKTCQLSSALPQVTWTLLATEHQGFTTLGAQSVRYGFDTRWITRTVSGAFTCSNGAFGGDPAVGQLKRCELARAGSGPNQPPAVSIASPAPGATYRAGQSLAFVGSATDPEDGAVPASRLTWWADFHHDTHTHPFQLTTPGGSGTLNVPVRGETSDNVFIRFHLRAVDAQGIATEATRDVLPQKARMSFVTVPAGLQLTLDGQPFEAPRTVTGVVGVERDFGAADQSAGGRRYRFAGWSDGGAATHVVATPASDTTYTASFTDIGPADNAAPEVVLTAPGTAVRGSPVALSATASDADGTIARVQFLDGATLVGEDTASPYAATWTPSTSGTHTLTARATDNLGASTVSATRTVTVSEPTTGDRTPPSVALTAPANLATGLSGTITLSANASDNVGVQSVEFQVDGAAVGAPDTAAPYAVTFDTNALATGQHVVRARARDAAGNVSAWSTALVTFGGFRNMPQGFTRVDNWATGLASATAMTIAPDGRLFICEQAGRVRVVRNGTLLPTPFATVTADASGERGLAGIVFDPQFATNGIVYVYYTSPQGGSHNRISRFTANGDVAAGPETVLLDLPLLGSGTFHNGGAMVFGNDGKLYVGVGENDIASHAQDPNDPLGKLLRFNADGTIPSDNPFFASRTGQARAIWASGLRNPFTMAIQPGTGRIHVNDVGQSTWEEINLGAPGANYGWALSEGPDRVSAGITAPLFAYRHGATTPPGSGPGGFLVGFAIAGGAFYPTSGPFPASYRGNYFFADFVAGWIARLDLANGNAAYVFATGFASPVDLDVGPDGALYVLTRTGVARLTAP